MNLKKYSANNFVDALYTALLDRDPDVKGRDNMIRTLKKGVSLEKIIKKFITSNEYTNRNFWRVWKKRTSVYKMKPNQIEGDIVELFDRTATYWRNAGTDPKEIYFSVLMSAVESGE